MQWELIVALVIAIPIILFPAAFVWYLNIGGIYAAVKDARERRAARDKAARDKAAPVTPEYEEALRDTLKHYPW